MRHNVSVTVLWYKLLSSNHLNFVAVILKGLAECFASHFIGSECSYECFLLANSLNVVLFNLQDNVRVTRNLFITSSLLNKTKTLFLQQIIMLCQSNNFVTTLDWTGFKLYWGSKYHWTLNDNCKKLSGFFSKRSSPALESYDSHKNIGNRMLMINCFDANGRLESKIYSDRGDELMLKPQHPTPSFKQKALDLNVLYFQIINQHAIYCFIKNCKAYYCLGFSGGNRRCGQTYTEISPHAVDLVHLTQKNIFRTLWAADITITTANSKIRIPALALLRDRTRNFIEPGKRSRIEIGCAGVAYNRDSAIKTFFLPPTKLQHNYTALNSILNLAEKSLLTSEGQKGKMVKCLKDFGSCGCLRNKSDCIASTLIDLVDILTSLPKLQWGKKDPVGIRRRGAELVELLLELGVPLKLETVAFALTLFHLRKASSLSFSHSIRFICDNMKSLVCKLGYSSSYCQSVVGGSLGDLIAQFNCLTNNISQRKTGLRVLLRLKGILKELGTGSICRAKNGQMDLSDRDSRRMLELITRIGYLVLASMQHADYQSVPVTLSVLSTPTERFFNKIFILNRNNDGAVIVSIAEKLLRYFISFLN